MRRSQIPNLDPPSGLFLLRPARIYDYDFVPLDNRIRDPRCATLAGSIYKILQSCNGLLLCCTRIPSDDYYVYNPSINNMFKLLPQCDKNLALYLGGGGQMRMAYDPTKSPHYKVFHAELFHNQPGSFIQIQTYSSQTGNWSAYAARLYPPACFCYFYKGIYWNNAIHWLNCPDGQTILHYKLDVDHQVLTNIQTRVTLDDDKVDSDCQLFESRGFLLFVTLFDTDHVPKLNIYGMRNEDSVWSVKYIVNLDEVRIFPKIWSVATSFWASFGVLSIILGEREDDSFLVMVLYDKVVRYNFVSQTVSTLCDFVSYAPPESFQLIASFARV
ncbi:hypothetical protein Tco_0969203 [Tanacetum coccineum]